MDNYLDLSPLLLSLWVVLGFAMWNPFPPVEKKPWAYQKRTNPWRIKLLRCLQILWSKTQTDSFKNVRISIVTCIRDFTNNCASDTSCVSLLAPSQCPLSGTITVIRSGHQGFPLSMIEKGQRPCWGTSTDESKVPLKHVKWSLGGESVWCCLSTH